MKTASDPRHTKRIKIVQRLFSSSFRKRPLWKSLKLIDLVIAKSAPEWPIEKLDKLDLAILRLAVYEILIDKQAPIRVIIDEAVEIAKEFGHESSPNFINGALGSIVKNKMKTKEAILNFLANEWHCDAAELTDDKPITEADLVKIQDVLGLEISEEEKQILTLGDLLEILAPEPEQTHDH